MEEKREISLPEAAPIPEGETVAEEKKKILFPRLTSFLKEKRGGALPLVLSFFLPFFIFTLCLAFQGVYPFGDKQIINYDGWHQYYPFLLNLWDHFKEGTSLLYDWSMGMGTNFLSMLSYYGSSPFNLLIFLSPQRDFRVLFMLFVCIRIGLAGLFCAAFLRKIVKNPGWSVIFFSLGYALCGYLMGYYWNNMWLDTVALLPLLCLATLKLFREGKASLYVFTLFLSLFANYYIGYMSALFIVIVFITLCVVDRVRFSDFLKKGFRLLFATLLGAALSAILLLPAFFGLFSTASTQDAVPMYVSFYESIRNLLAPLSSFHEPAVMDGLPNLTTAAILALFAFAYLWAKKIGLREKVMSFFTLVFLLLSMNFSVLNYIFHGMHYTNMIPYRFAYLFAFVVVVMAYRYYKEASDGFDWIDGVGMLLFAVLTAFCAFDIYPQWSVLATVAVLAVSVVANALRAGNLIPKKAFSLFVCAVILVETGVGAWLGTKAVGTTDYSSYFDLETGDRIRELVALAEEKEGDKKDFYRMEVTQWRSLNDSCFYEYNGISQFASSANRGVALFLEGLGMPADPGSNRFVYVHGTPLSNTLLGVKYLINKDGKLSDTDLELVSEEGSVLAALYRCTGFSGLGFMVKEGSQDFRFDLTQTPYQRQNALFTAITGLEGDLFTPIYAQAGEHTNLTVESTSPDRFTFTGPAIPEGEDTSRVLRLTYQVPAGGDVYIYADVPMAGYTQVNNAWHCIEDYPNLFSAGAFAPGDTFQLRTIIDEEGNEEFTGQASFDVFVMNRELWQAGIEKIQDEKMEILSFEDTYVKGKVNVKTNGYLYTSIPMENEGNWRVTVDGKEVEVEPFAGSFVGVPLAQGEHVVEFSYSPKGFVPGAVITLVAILLFAALILFEKRGKILFPEKIRPFALPEEILTEEEAEIHQEGGAALDHSETDVHHPQGD